MLRYQQRPGWIGAIALTVAAACGRSTQSAGRYLCSEGPVTWLNDGRLVFMQYAAASLGASSADCGKRGLYTMDSAGGRAALVVPEQVRPGEDLKDFDISRDGRFAAYADGKRLLEADLATGEVRNITNAKLRLARFPSWSPDAERIAFLGQSVTDTAFGHWELYIVERSGSALRAVTSLGGRSVFSGPSWSPGTGELVLSSPRGDSHNVWTGGEILTIDTVRKQLVSLKSGSWPSWSPTGEWIAYVSFDLKTEAIPRVWATSIHLVRWDGSDDHIVYTSQEQGTTPHGSRDRWVFGSPLGPLVWSPDGRQLAFGRDTGRANSVWTIDTSGMNLAEWERTGPSNRGKE